MRTSGNGFMTVASTRVSWRTWPEVGTGVGAGAATSKTGAGVAGVGTGVATGRRGRGRGRRGVAAALTGPLVALTGSTNRDSTQCTKTAATGSDAPPAIQEVRSAAVSR